jgi:hypothetical protein
MTNSTSAPRLFALAALVTVACGTKYVAELDTQAQAGSGSGESGGTDDATAGHTGAQSSTAAPTTDDSGGDSTGAAACEPEASCFSGGDVTTTFFTAVRDPDLGLDDVAEDCTLGSSAYDDFGEFWVVSFACPVVDAAPARWVFTGPLPAEAAARLVVDATYRVRWTRADAYTQVFSVSDAQGAMEFLAQRGASIEPFGAPSVYGDFTITALDDVCAPTCVPAETCWGQDQQQLVFGLGDDEVQVWDHSHGVVGDYSIAVGQATGVEKVHPDSPACEFENFPVYDFTIANVAAP